MVGEYHCLGCQRIDMRKIEENVVWQTIYYHNCERKLFNERSKDEWCFQSYLYLKQTGSFEIMDDDK